MSPDRFLYPAGWVGSQAVAIRPPAHLGTFGSGLFLGLLVKYGPAVGALVGQILSDAKQGRQLSA